MGLDNLIGVFVLRRRCLCLMGNPNVGATDATDKTEILIILLHAA